MSVDPRDALVASPHFEWTDGMRGLGDDGSAWAFVERDGDDYLFSRNTDRFLRWCERGDMWPDIDHGGTQGEMLALVRKAWGCDEYRRLTIEVAGAGWCVIVRNGKHRPPSRARPGWDLDPVCHPRYRGQEAPFGANEFATDGLALAAALLAAPLPSEVSRA